MKPQETTKGSDCSQDSAPPMCLASVCADCVCRRGGEGWGVWERMPDRCSVHSLFPTCCLFVDVDRGLLHVPSVCQSLQRLWGLRHVEVCRNGVGWVIWTCHRYIWYKQHFRIVVTARADWFEHPTPLTNQHHSWLSSQTFSRALCRLHVFASSFDWLIGLS